MKNLMKTMLAMFFLFGTAFIFIQCETEPLMADDVLDELVDVRGWNPPSAGNKCPLLNDTYPMEELNPDEVDALIFMVEEEKLARDVYLTLGETYDINVFKNIPIAENRHMEAVQGLITKYSLESQAVENERGVFDNETLKGLYNDLVIRGEKDLTEALKVGATIEDLDIKDLTDIIEGGKVDNKDLLAVFEELRRGSRNHMRAFVRNLNKTDATYEPRYISEEMYTSIIESEMEKGSKLCNGEGDGKKGNNKGNCKSNCSGKKQGQNNNGTCVKKGQGNGNGICNNSGQGQGNGKKKGQGNSPGNGGN
jgi:hypothetical protein